MHCTDPRAAAAAPRRFFPAPGRRLSVANIRGAWRPSGAVGGCGMFAVVWHTRAATFWAPLHDSDATSQGRLIAECRWIDRQAGYPGAWPEGRTE